MLWFTNDSIAQEFVPTKPALAFAELITESEDFWSELLTVEVRHKNAVGPVIGSSLSQASMGEAGLTHFDFYPVMTLVPGDTYVLRIVRNGSLAKSAVAVDYSAGYQKGSAIIPGQQQQELDLWFREGMPGPETRRLELSILPDRTMTVTAGSPTNPCPSLITFFVEYSDDLIHWHTLNDSPRVYTWTTGFVHVFSDWEGIEVVDRPMRFFRAVDASFSTNSQTAEVQQLSGSAP